MIRAEVVTQVQGMFIMLPLRKCYVLSVDDAALAQMIRAAGDVGRGDTGAGGVDDAALAHVIRAEVGHRGVGDVGRGESHRCRGCWPRWVTQCRGC